MASFGQLFEKCKTNLFKTYSNDAGKMLLHTATLGWIFSAAGQIFGIVTNDKVSKKQKKFLIPQEIADAAINIISFYTLTACIQNSAKKLASSGKIITPAIRKFCEEHGIKCVKGKGESTPNIGNAILDKVKKYQSIIDANIEKETQLGLPKSKTDILEIKKKELNDFYDTTYSPFESGIKVIGNVTGAVLSSNIITPLLRNPIAAYKQKQDMARDEIKKQNIKPSQNVVLGQNRISIDNYKTQVTTGGSMRI